MSLVRSLLKQLPLCYAQPAAVLATCPRPCPTTCPGNLDCELCELGL